MMGYLSGFLGLAAVGALIHGQMIAADRDSIAAELDVMRLELSTCGGQLSNVLEDVRSDNAIDQIPDSALADVPAHWLLGVADPGAGSGQ